MSTPNLPHTENLMPLYELVILLQGLVGEANAIKDNIANSVDSLSIQANNQPAESKQAKLAQLKLKNQQLKTELENKTRYSTVITNLLNNYELSIQTVLDSVRSDVVSYNLKLLQLNRDYYQQLQDKSGQEYRMYRELVEKRLVVFRISELLRKLLTVVDEEFVLHSRNASEAYKLLTCKKVLEELSDKKRMLQSV